MTILKQSEPIIISKDLLKKLTSKLSCYVLDKKEKALTVNKNLGSCQEGIDYVQEVLMCVLKKIKNGDVNFYSEHQLWTYCFKVLNMLLLKQHRDYSKVKSKTATLLDINSVYETTGKTIDDIIGFEKFNKYKTPEYTAIFNSYKDFVICINEEISITPVTELYKFDINSKFINLYTFIENINKFGIGRTLLLYNIKISEKIKLFDSLKNFFGTPHKKQSIKNQPILYSITTELSSRDKNFIEKLKNENNMKKIPFEKFKKLIC